jgi:uncharacterized membrane protein YgaE (UPF0421/DUF939 family)
VTGLIFLLVAGPEGWVLPLALTVTVLICTYAVELPISWRIAPITAALVIAPGVVEHSTSSALEVALHRSGEVILGSAVALLVSWVMSKIWAVGPEYERQRADKSHGDEAR